jgi:hypothetical protein
MTKHNNNRGSSSVQPHSNLNLQQPDMNLFPQNHAPCANVLLRRLCQISGLTKWLGACLLLAALTTTAPAANVTLAWNASPNTNVAGYIVYYGEASQSYTSSVNVGANLSEVFSTLTPGVAYYFAALAYNTNGQESVFSDEATYTIPLPLAILTQPLSQTVNAGTAASLTATFSGAAPLFIQPELRSRAINFQRIASPASDHAASDGQAILRRN